MKLYVNERCPKCDNLVEELLKHIPRSHMHEIEIVNILPSEGIEFVPVIFDNGIEYLGVQACLNFLINRFPTTNEPVPRGITEDPLGSLGDRSVNEQFDKLLASRKA